MEPYLLPIIAVAGVACVGLVAYLSLRLSFEAKENARLVIERAQISGYWDETIQANNKAQVALADALIEIAHLEADKLEADEQIVALIDLNKETEERVQMLERQLFLELTIAKDGNTTYICG